MENKRGRKKVQNPRDIEIRFRVNEEENEQIEALAKLMGVNKSKLIRDLLLEDLTVDFDTRCPLCHSIICSIG